MMGPSITKWLGFLQVGIGFIDVSFPVTLVRGISLSELYQGFDNSCIVSNESMVIPAER